VWPAGTCLGIDPSTNQPTDAPVDCGAPHAMEVTGAVNLAEKFPGALPPDADQDAYIKEACTRMTDAYLAPTQLRTTTLTLIYSTVSLPSWNAGSHQVSCSIGATLGNGGWATLINPAKGALLINGMPPVPPPDIPQERLNMPPIPLVPDAPSTTYSPSTTNNSQYTGTQQTQQSQTQHLPQQQSTVPTTQQQAPPSTVAPPPAPPPPPALAPENEAPPMEGGDAPPPPEGPPPAPGPPPGPVEPVIPPAA